MPPEDKPIEKPADDLKPDDGKPAADAAGEEVDYKAEADKWKAMSRKHEGEAKANRDAAKRLQDIEEANKTETQKLADQAAASDKVAAAAQGELLRLKVAMRKGLTETQAKRLIGANEEELEADADELVASFRKEDGDEKKDAGPTRPKEKLKSGATGADAHSIPQLTQEDLKGMSPAAINKAREAGQCNELLGIK